MITALTLFQTINDVSKFKTVYCLAGAEVKSVFFASLIRGDSRQIAFFTIGFRGAAVTFSRRISFMRAKSQNLLCSTCGSQGLSQHPAKLPQWKQRTMSGS